MGEVVVLSRPTGRATVSGTTGRTALSERELAVRVVALERVASRYRELVDPLNGGGGVRGDGGSVGLMPHESDCALRVARFERAGRGVLRCTCAFRSVVEFERLARRLREEERELWRHLDGWWLSAETRTVWLCPRCGVCHQPEHRHPSRRSAGRLVTVRCKRVVVWRRLPGAREGLARAGLRRMAEWWGLGMEPELPADLRLIA